MLHFKTKKSLYKKNTVWIMMILIFVSMMATTGCNNNQPPEGEDNSIHVYASSYVLADLTEKIAGNLVEVENIIPPGVEPHDFEPSPRQMAELQKADIFVYNGAGLDAWVTKLSDTLKVDTLLIDSTQNIKLIVADDSHEDEHKDEHKDEHDGATDPHVWLDPTNTILQGEVIKEALIQLDTKNQDIYNQNFEELKIRLIKLDQLYRDTLKNAERKHIFVSHAAFGYLAKRYEIEQIAISGLNPQDEPSPKEMMEIVDKARDYQIEYILLEPLVQSKYAQTIMNEINAKSLILHPIDGLTKEELDRGEDYFSIMEENLEVLKVALGVK